MINVPRPINGMETNNQVDKDKHMIVGVKWKNRYGTPRLYPANDLARMALDLHGGKEITDRMVEVFKAYGYTVQVVAMAAETL